LVYSLRYEKNKYKNIKRGEIKIIKDKIEITSSEIARRIKIKRGNSF